MTRCTTVPPRQHSRVIGYRVLPQNLAFILSESQQSIQMRTRQHLLSEQVVQLPLAVLQPTAVRAIHHPNQPVGLSNKQVRGKSDNLCAIIWVAKLITMYALKRYRLGVCKWKVSEIPVKGQRLDERGDRGHGSYEMMQQIANASKCS